MKAIRTFCAAIIAMAALGFVAGIAVQAQEKPALQKGPTPGQPVEPVRNPPKTPPEATKLPIEKIPPAQLQLGGVYTFTLNSFQITNTRSLHNDTDFVSFAVAVGKNAPITVPTKSMGNLNNGTFQVNLTIPNVTVGPSDKVAFSYSIVNTGYNANSVEQALKTAVTAAAAKAAAAAGAAVGGGVGGLIGATAGPWLAGNLEGIVFVDCDGTVAAADHTFTAAALASVTANGRVDSSTDNNKGTDSPVGCGGNSQYYVTWSVSGHPAEPVAKKK